MKDTLFSKLILSGKFDLSEEIFIDRSPKLFPFILNFIRFSKLNYKRFTKEELSELLAEADYYEIGEISQYLEDRLEEIEFISYESSGAFIYNNQTAGTESLEGLKDKSLTKGICAKSPGWIVIELNSEWEFEEIELAGWNGNSTWWYAGKIQTSIDKKTWKDVGLIPSNYGSMIQTVKVTKSSAKYVKFSNDSYIGIGYLNIKKIV